MYASARNRMNKTAIFLTAFASCLIGFPALAQQDVEVKPIGHIELSNPADLTKQQAEQIYLSVLPEIKAIFAMSDIVAATKYTSWKRYNNAPYISATHGARYVDNYANGIAKNYGQLTQGETYPEGSILAKDSFSVTSNQSIFPGALFLMEKMRAGFNKASGNWRYTMVLPDGSVFGTTHGENSENVEFCIGCHAAKATLDHIFYVPTGYSKEQ